MRWRSLLRGGRCRFLSLGTVCLACLGVMIIVLPRLSAGGRSMQVAVLDFTTSSTDA